MQRLLRGRRQPPGGSASPWGLSGPGAREGAWVPGKGLPGWPALADASVRPQRQSPKRIRRDGGPSTLAARPQRGRRGLPGGAPRGPQLQGVEVEGSVLGVGVSGLPRGMRSPTAGGGVWWLPWGAREPRALVGGGTGLARPGGAPLSSAKMPAAPRGLTLGKFPPARKARVGSAPRAARARGGGERSQRHFRGAEGGCGARATWAQRWAFRAACGGADARRTGNQPRGCFQLYFP